MVRWRWVQILLKPLVVQVKDILETGRYKEDTPTNPFWTNHLVRLVNTMGCISRGSFYLPLETLFCFLTLTHTPLPPTRHPLRKGGEGGLLERSNRLCASRVGCPAEHL